jgi:hypothetical protein
MSSDEKEKRGVIDRVRDFLSSTKNLILTAGGLASAVAAILALVSGGGNPEPQAKLSGVRAYSDVSLSQFDVRNEEGEAPEHPPGAAKTTTGAIVYRLLADTARTSTAPRRTAGARIEHGTGASRASVVAVLNAISTSSQSGRGTGPSEVPAQGSETRTQAGTTPAPAPPTATETATTTSAVTTTGPATSGQAPPTATQTAGPTTTSQAPLTANQTTEPPSGGGAPTTTSTQTSGGTTSARTRNPTTATRSGPEIVIPDRCRIAFCGATEEIDKALTDSPNAATAAAAVAELFRDSRAEVVGRRLYPIGVAVAYSLKLEGWAHRRATLRWSLWSEGENQALPRPWWRNITVAQITPSGNRETLSGEFWVPIPPNHGSYFIHLKVYDAKGVSRADSDSSPLVH